MSRMLSLLVGVMLLLTLGLAQAPRVCAGDGRGGACQPTACVCVSACSCQEAHRRAAAFVEAVPDCCAVEPAATSACHSETAATASACHGPGDWPHFAPQDRHWFALVPAWPRILLTAPDTAMAPGAPARPAHRSHAPPEKPPRLLG